MEENKDLHQNMEAENFDSDDQNNLEENLQEPVLDNDLVDNKIKDLEQKLSEYKDMYLRSQAEMQNLQRRTLDDVKKSRDYAISNFAKDIIVVKDYLEMALKDQSGNIETMKIGVDLTLKQLIQIFEKQKITEILPNKTDKLDPNLHQAINTVEVENQETNTVVDVMQKGYLLNDRVLRPAMVSVAK